MISTRPDERPQTLTGILEFAMQSLDVSDEQRSMVEAEYKKCSRHLARSLQAKEEEAFIYPQGSMRLRTAVRPIRGVTDVFDLDVVFFLDRPTAGLQPDVYRNDIGAHLRTLYNGRVSPLAKGWRLDFTKEGKFHLDIIPAVRAKHSGEVIAITDGKGWKESNPKEYATWFDKSAEVMPRLRVSAGREGALTMANEAKVDPLPEKAAFAGSLRRIVQVSKRHRDYYFSRTLKRDDLAPASIVVTTLLTKAYTKCVLNGPFETGFDLLRACVDDMRGQFNEVPFATYDGRRLGSYKLLNPSLLAEDLVVRWKEKPEMARAFEGWLEAYRSNLNQLTEGEHDARGLLSGAFGEEPVSAAFAIEAQALEAARKSGRLHANMSGGVGVGSGILVPQRKFHGT